MNMEAAPAPASGPVEVNPSDVAAAVDGGREPTEKAPEDFWDPDEEYMNKKVRRKVNGQDSVKTLKEWLDQSAFGEKANQSLSEASKIRKEAEQWKKSHDGYLEQQRGIFDAIKADPDNLFELGRHLGHDVEKIMFERVMEQVKYRTASEEERAQIDRAREYEQMKREVEQTRSREQHSKKQQFQAQFNQSIVGDAQVYAETHPEFLRDGEWQADAIEEMIRARDKGRRMSLADAAENVRQKYERISSGRADRLLQERIKAGNIPADLRKEMNSQDIERAKAAKRANFAQPAKQNSAQKGPSVDEFFSSLRSR